MRQERSAGNGSFRLGCSQNVIQGAGFECTNLLDESTAANQVLQMKNGAVVDIGGGTTGISILKDGEVVYIADEPTGGTHFSLVIAGAYGKSFQEAEVFKRDESHHKELGTGHQTGGRQGIFDHQQSH